MTFLENHEVNEMSKNMRKTFSLTMEEIIEIVEEVHARKDNRCDTDMAKRVIKEWFERNRRTR